ncbi:hypothetical protein BS47DRAFT_1341908 [Hydnum rufescens UP504]|uniref:Uncharacterized protein n=1 Tax=Hydnum rufescens UP504 TaxID=1448309 RepID=A0A9P6DZ22_9AGAM|nr:hypothetical protein BS47DRAFT_1341908 [Hydnum rufescens UP504]
MTDCSWSFALREGENYTDPESEGLDEDSHPSQPAVSSASQPEEGQVKYQPNPWSIAKINAATRVNAPRSHTKAMDRTTGDTSPSQRASVTSGFASHQSPRIRRQASILTVSVNPKQEVARFSSRKDRVIPSKMQGHRPTTSVAVLPPPRSLPLPLKSNATLACPEAEGEDSMEPPYPFAHSLDDLAPYVPNLSTTRSTLAPVYNDAGIQDVALTVISTVPQSPSQYSDASNTFKTYDVNIPWTPQSLPKYPRGRPEDYMSDSFATSTSPNTTFLGRSNADSHEHHFSSILHSSSCPVSQISPVDAREVPAMLCSDSPHDFQVIMQHAHSQPTEKILLPSPQMTSPLIAKNKSSDGPFLHSLSQFASQYLGSKSRDVPNLQASAQKRPCSASSTPPSSPTPQSQNWRPPYLLKTSKSAPYPHLPPIRRANLEAADDVVWSTLPVRKRKTPKRKARDSGIITTARFSLPLAAFGDGRGRPVQSTAKPAYRPPPKHAPHTNTSVGCEPGWPVATTESNVSTSCATSTRKMVQVNQSEVLTSQNGLLSPMLFPYLRFYYQNGN